MSALDAEAVGVELVGVLKPIVGRCDAGLADQIRRAANSMVLNIAEADGRSGRDRKNRFRIARGSALEVRAGLKLAVAWGYSPRPGEAEALLDRLAAMLWRLTR